MTRMQAILLSLMGVGVFLSVLGHIFCLRTLHTLLQWSQLNSDNIKKLYGHLETQLRRELKQASAEEK